MVAPESFWWSVNSLVCWWTTGRAATGAKFSWLEDHNILLSLWGRAQTLYRLCGAEHITVEPDVRWKICELMELSHKRLLHLLPLHFVLLLFFPPLVSAGHSLSLLSVCLGIVMSEACPTESHAAKAQAAQPCWGTCDSGTEAPDTVIPLDSW